MVLSHGDDKDIVIALLTAHPDALAFQSATPEVFIGPEGATLPGRRSTSHRASWNGVFESVVQEEDARSAFGDRNPAQRRERGRWLGREHEASHGMDMG